MSAATTAAGLRYGWTTGARATVAADACRVGTVTEPGPPLEVGTDVVVIDRAGEIVGVSGQHGLSGQRGVSG